MLFKKKDNADGSKAKNSLFAHKAKIGTDTDGKVVAAPKSATKESASSKTLKTTVATGKVGSHILTRPRITEKATMGASQNVYVFDVAKRANKNQIAEAVKDVYGITPVQVRVLAIPTKTSVNRRGAQTTTGGGKKAYVYLKKGDTIELI